MPPKKIDSTNALKEVERRNAAIGPTVKLRATQRGYYGRPIADIVEPGTVFKMAVKDLVPFAGQKGRKMMEIGGAKYVLPTWCEDAAMPVAASDDADESAAETFDESVI